MSTQILYNLGVETVPNGVDSKFGRPGCNNVSNINISGGDWRHFRNER